MGQRGPLTPCHRHVVLLLSKRTRHHWHDHHVSQLSPRRDRPASECVERGSLLRDQQQLQILNMRFQLLISLGGVERVQHGRIHAGKQGQNLCVEREGEDKDKETEETHPLKQQ